jgi:hypothetical protein
MTTKTQLQTKIQELEAELQSFKQQLNTYKETPTIQEASVGDVLEDGSIVLQKSNGLALLVAPKSTEVEATWSKEFSEVFQKLKEQGFNPSQWFVPTEEQLQLAYNTIRGEFSATLYWSSTEINATYACFVCYLNGIADCGSKAFTYCVRAFKCVTY